MAPTFLLAALFSATPAAAAEMGPVLVPAIVVEESTEPPMDELSLVPSRPGQASSIASLDGSQADTSVVPNPSLLPAVIVETVQ